MLWTVMPWNLNRESTSENKAGLIVWCYGSKVMAEIYWDVKSLMTLNRAWPESMGIKCYLQFVPETMTEDELEREDKDPPFLHSFI